MKLSPVVVMLGLAQLCNCTSLASTKWLFIVPSGSFSDQWCCYHGNQWAHLNMYFSLK